MLILRLILALFATSAVAQNQPQNPPSPGGPQPFPPQEPRERRPLRQGMQQDGPWFQNLRQAVLEKDGTVQSQGFWLQSGGVASLVKDQKGRLVAAFQWFPQGEQELFDKVAIRFSSDAGESWTTPRKVNIEDLPEGMSRPYDPTLAVLPDGALRLYFTSHRVPHLDTSAIYSALSKDGGETFTFESGARLAVEGTGLMDCAVAKLADSWHMICPKREGGAFHAVSPDGLKFSRTDDVSGEPGQQWIGNLTVHGDKLRFWMGSPDGVIALESAEGIKWKRVLSTKFSGMDPAPLPLDDGRTLLIATGGPTVPGPMRPTAGPGPLRSQPPREPREPDAEPKREPSPAPK